MADHVNKAGGPSLGDVHVPTAGGKKKPSGPLDALKPGRPLRDIEDERAADAKVSKAAPAPSPLYVSRKLLNADELIAWAKGAGFAVTYPADEMHVTVCFSRNPVDWMAMGQSDWGADPKGDLVVAPGGPRQLARFGPTENCAVLMFASSELQWRHRAMVDQGASWDFETYYPHITISQTIGDLDLSTIEPYQGPLKFGPELFGPVKEKAMADVVEKGFESFFKVSGVDEELGLVFGWGIVCKDNGVDYYDTQRNHIPEDAMVSATTDFMKSARVHGDMHVRGTGPELAAGVVVHSFPLTTEIAKAMGIATSKTGWMVATAPDKAMLAKFRSGEYTGFSIGGEHLEIDGQLVAELQRAA